MCLWSRSCCRERVYLYQDGIGLAYTGAKKTNPQNSESCANLGGLCILHRTDVADEVFCRNIGQTFVSSGHTRGSISLILSGCACRRREIRQKKPMGKKGF